MACAFETDPHETFPGTTLYTKAHSNCVKRTHVYMPPNHADFAGLNIVIFLHGYFVNGFKFLFKSDPTKLRQQVKASSRDFVMIAPYLGYATLEAIGDYNTRTLGEGKWGEKYLDDVLKGLGKFIKPDADSYTPTVKNLFLACHSGGGAAMRGLVDTLGSYKSYLRECWGFDCLYGAKAKPDDAKFWFDKVTGPGGVPLYVYFGPSTTPQSVKLYLMKMRLADENGNQSVSTAHEVANINVTIGQSDLSSGVTPNPVDDLMTRERPGKVHHAPATHGKTGQGEYAAHAAANVLRNATFAKTVHYDIARAYLLARLKAAPLK